MNLLSLTNHDYIPELMYNRITTYWELSFVCNHINDRDSYNKLTEIDLETLRDNAKRIYEKLKDI